MAKIDFVVAPTQRITMASSKKKARERLLAIKVERKVNSTRRIIAIIERNIHSFFLPCIDIFILIRNFRVIFFESAFIKYKGEYYERIYNIYMLENYSINKKTPLENISVMCSRSVYGGARGSLSEFPDTGC